MFVLISSLTFLIAHFGLWIAIYNRVNGYHLPRRIVKPLMKSSLALAIVFPIYLLAENGLSLGLPEWGSIFSWQASWLLNSYFCLVYSSYLWLGVPWLLARPLLRRNWVETRRTTRTIAMKTKVNSELALTSKCRWFSKIPLNQIFDLSVEELDLPVPGLPPQLDGYRIAHLSDVHLTGDVDPSFTRQVIEIANQWKPECYALTGDLIDNEACLSWMDPIFRDAEAPDGRFFVLGNHDARMKSPEAIRSSMVSAGWTDLGGKELSISFRNERVTMIGNEAPWFPHTVVPTSTKDQFCMMLSHSPDQIRWARQHQVHLMIAGHTHGGQGRLPLIGPVLSPSIYGSRFASGQFYLAPTTMHVTRGLSGTRLMRINCRPELSLLTLRSDHPN